AAARGALPGGGPPAAARRTAAAAAAATSAGYDHVVVVMLENRSFDHFLGWLPGADGRQQGLAYRDRAGVLHPTHPLAPDFQGCGHPDPDHSAAGGRIEYNGGRADGWLRAGANDDYAIGYYRQADLAFLGRAVPQWTTFSRYFSATLAETYPNRIYQHAGQTDRFKNTTALCTLPTIWDRLQAAGLSGRYYFGDVPFLALWGTKYLPISRPSASFFADCAAGTLPNVSYLDPRFEDEDSGTSGDDHPHADIRNGEAFMASIYRAVTTSPNWPRTVLIFNFDEWGGFYDHVPPTAAPIPAADAAAGSKDGLRGFRVPCLMVSPLARRGRVSSRVYDHTSILRMIERRWGLAPLSVRDGTANDIGAELTASPNVRAPAYDVPPGPFGGPCGAPALPGTVSPEAEWGALRSVARLAGWPV
ncbi:MAG: phospholipase, partial [Solirubrobacteraceae bacterium]|nr:phospholipase [Solirubrobacteraceae bacterium]